MKSDGVKIQNSKIIVLVKKVRRISEAAGSWSKGKIRLY